MAEIMRIQGKIENVMSIDDFARLLREKLGDDAEDYFLCALDDAKHAELDSGDLLEKCGGECDRVYEIQGNHESIVSEVAEALQDLRVYKSEELKVVRLIRLLKQPI